MKFLKKNIVELIFIVFVAAVLVTGVYYYTPYDKDTDVYTADEEITTEDNKVLEEIRSREDVRQQQELIVQEIYLIEQKEKVEAQKEIAIVNFDTEIESIEKKLELVREQKLSFQ